MVVDATADLICMQVWPNQANSSTQRLTECDCSPEGSALARAEENTGFNRTRSFEQVDTVYDIKRNGAVILVK